MVEKISPYITFDTYVKDLYLQMYNMIKNDKTIMKSGNIIRLAGQLKPGSVVNEKGDVGQNLKWTKTAKVFEYGYQYEVSSEPYHFDELYVTWGFFEDNVLSRFFSRIIDDGKGIMGEFRSYEEAIDPQTGELVNIPIRIRNHEKMLTTDLTKFLLLKHGQAMETWARDNWKNQWYPWADCNSSRTGFQHQWFGTEVFVGSPVDRYGDVNLKIFDYKPSGHSDYFYSTEWGVLRNVYFNVKHLSQLMSEATGIEAAINNVWQDFSAEYGGIYDFYLDYSDDQNRIVVKDRGWTLNAVQEALDKNNRSHPANPDPANDEDDKSKTDGLFEFPTWEKNSIVKSQNLSARLPDRMKLVAMYGASNLPDDDPENKDSFTSTDHDDQAGLAWGRLTSPAASDFGLTGLSTEDYEKKVLASALLGEIDYPWRDNRLFGEKEADINKELYIQKLPADDDDTQGTKIYDSIIQKIIDREHAEYIQILVEIAADVTGDKDAVYEDYANQAQNLKRKREARELLWKKNMKLRASGELGFEALLGMYQAKGFQPWNDVTGVKYSGGPLGGQWSVAYPFKLSSAFKQFMMKDIRGKGGMVEKSDPLVPIEFELEIDGVGGIFPGNAFQSSYLPEKYKKIACFQVVGLNQKLDSSGWTSTIKGQIRVSIKSEDDIPPDEGEGDGSSESDAEKLCGGVEISIPLPGPIEETINEIEEDITAAEAEPEAEAETEEEYIEHDTSYITEPDHYPSFTPRGLSDLVEEQQLTLAQTSIISSDRDPSDQGVRNYKGGMQTTEYAYGHPAALSIGDFDIHTEVDGSNLMLVIDEMGLDPTTAQKVARQAVFGHEDSRGNLRGGLFGHIPDVSVSELEGIYNNVLTAMSSDYGDGGSRTIILMSNEVWGGFEMDWSDRRLKKNIELIGKSPSGINIYEWEYKDVNFINILSDKVYGDGKYRGVMADDIPFDAVTELDNGYLAVNYSKIDVDFEKIKRYKNDHRPT
jgi:hypothetical protein